MEWLDECGYFGGSIHEAILHGLNLPGVDERLVALHIDNYIIFHTQGLDDLVVGFLDTIGAALVIGRRHDDTSIERGHSVVDTVIVGGNNCHIDMGSHLLIDTLNDRFASEQSEWLAGETGAGISRRNNSNGFHSYLWELTGVSGS